MEGGKRKKRDWYLSGEVVKEVLTNLPVGDVALVEKILMNLGARDLCRLSYVSKSWNSIVHDSGFKIRHNKVARGREMLIFTNHKPPYIRKKLDSCQAATFVANKQAGAIVSSALPTPAKLLIFASCDGLLCVQLPDYLSLFLWNPSTGEHRKLPHCPYSTLDHNNFVFGLGHNSVGDDYKLLVIPKLREGGEMGILLYSLKSNSWRKMNIINVGIAPYYGDQRCAFVNGALHWVDYRKNIFSFNLSTEELGLVAPPKHPAEVRELDFAELGVLKGKLCMSVCYNESRIRRFLLWLMGEDGAWVGVFNMAIPSSLNLSHYAITPLYLYDNGNILLRVYAVPVGHANVYEWSRLYRYTKAKGKIQIITRYTKKKGMGMKDIISTNFYTCFNFLETLVSPLQYPS